MPETLEPAVERTERKKGGKMLWYFYRECKAHPLLRRVNLVYKLKDGFGPKDKVRYFRERAAG